MRLLRRGLRLLSSRLCLCLSMRNLVASCPLAPLLLFASRLPAGCRVACFHGCRVACCRLPKPRVTFCCAAASRVHPQPPLFVCASWLLHPCSLTAGCVIAVTDVQASLSSKRSCLWRRHDCDCRPRRSSSSWCCCPWHHCHCYHPSPSLSTSLPVAPSPLSSSSLPDTQLFLVPS